MADNPTTPKEEPKEEPKVEEQVKRKIPTSKGFIEVTDDQFSQLASLGAEQMLKDPEEKPKEEEKPKVPAPENPGQKKDESNSEYEKRIAALESRLQKADEAEKDRQFLMHVRKSVAQLGVPEDFREEAEEAIIGKVAVQSGKFDLNDLIKSQCDKLNKKLEKVGAKKINVEKKEEEQRKLGSSNSSGARAGDDPPKKFGKEAFSGGNKHKSFIEHISQRMKDMAEKASK